MISQEGTQPVPLCQACRSSKTTRIEATNGSKQAMLFCGSCGHMWPAERPPVVKPRSIFSRETIKNTAMPVGDDRNPPCPTCRRSDLVIAQRILRGSLVITELTCGRCLIVWTVGDPRKPRPISDPADWE